MNDPQNVHNYDGPVFNTEVSRAQFAWHNDTVTLNQQNNSTVAPGFEALAKLVTDLLRQLPQRASPIRTARMPKRRPKRSSRRSAGQTPRRRAGSAACLPCSRER
jgi:hypothetical protein